MGLDFGMTELAAFPAGGQIIDIGAGSGRFLQALSSRWKCFATEGSPITRKLLRERGVSALRIWEKSPRHHSGEFQIITLYQVLEHLSEFNATLADCRRLLAPGGKVIIVVPNGDAMIRQEHVTARRTCPRITYANGRLGAWRER